ncbi:glycosyl transferase, group 1 [Candidatus Moduliflexus flocculans]|uniref:Glycosyl transferase, group 1 n=1 Tax=Candidatus Moduliflexus flocculans TaxID=1499966 RepID=A0A081BM03_9BACT|nr:glycosyl transferase, group 1 [Candidatus Moduliflexus flocculans]
MNILFITEKFPYPLDSGGRIRTFHILKGLSQEHRITLITTIEQETQRQYLPDLQKICRDVTVITVKNETSVQLGKKILRNILSPIPIVVERHYQPEVAATVSRLLQSGDSSFDVVHFDHLDASIYANCLPPGMLTVLDEHNIVSNQIMTSAEVERNLLKRLYMQFQAQKTLRYEPDVCRKMTCCFVCSDTDKGYLMNIAKEAHVVTIPNGVDVEYFSDASWRRQASIKLPPAPQAMIFVGTLDYGPGATATRYFCHRILPLIHAQIPEATFLAVGQNPPQYLRDLANQDARILVTGRVDDIRPYVDRAKVFVVPLRSGSGTRLKILDAMAMSIPVVSTTIGAEGLNIRSGENILIADTPEDFSAAVLKLLQDDSFAASIKQNAFRFVRETYSWNTIWRDLLHAYQELKTRT